MGFGSQPILFHILFINDCSVRKFAMTFFTMQTQLYLRRRKKNVRKTPTNGDRERRKRGMNISVRLVTFVTLL